MYKRQVNDALIWGGSAFSGSTGGTVFAREERQSSIDTYRRWQLAEVGFGQDGYKSQNQVDVRAQVIVDGKPGSVGGDTRRGLRYTQWSISLAWFAHDVPLDPDTGKPVHIVPGQLSTFVLYALGSDLRHPLIQTLPLRSVRISFPDLDPQGNGYVRFDGTFGLQLSDPFTLWRYLLQNRDRAQVVAVASANNNSSGTTYGAIGQFYPREAPDGTRITFSIPFGYIPGTTSVYKDGLLQRPLVDYQETDAELGVFTFEVPPGSSEKIWIQCRTLGA